MPYLPAGLSSDDTQVTTLPPEVVERLQILDERTAAIIASQRRAEVRWKWQTIAAGAGALIAAVKLGIVVFPWVQERRQKRIGTLGEAVPNPHRRRR